MKKTALAIGVLCGAAQAEILIEPGESIQVRCQPTAEIIIDPPLSPGNPFFEENPPVCPVPNPAAGDPQKLIESQQTIWVNAQSTLPLSFFSSDGSDVEGITIEWEADAPLAISVSRCVGDFNVQALPRECFNGQAMGVLELSNVAAPEACQLVPWREYFVNISPINLLTGQPTCQDGFACEVDLTVTLNRP